MQIIVANLDCEAVFAEAAGVARFHPSHDVAQRISALGTLMAAFGQDGDVLWTPVPVDPDRVCGPVRVTLRSGALADLPRTTPEPITGWLAWGETHDVTARRKAGPGRSASPERAPRGPDWPDWPDWIDWLWSTPPDPEAAWRCNDRRFCLPLQEALGCRLPGAVLIDSVDALRAHLAAFDPGPAGWVLKAPFSASGRLRVRRRGRDPEREIEARIVRLLSRFGVLCFEPWMERVLDLGCLGLVVDADTCHVFPPHRLETDRAGVFRGIAIEETARWLAPEHHRAVVHAATEAGRALARAGYRGPFGIDAFVYRHDAAPGGQALQPMCEINARLSFGFIAHALARRLGMSRLRLRVDAGSLPKRDPSHAAQAAPADSIIPLLLPGAGDDTAAWIETGAA